MSPAQQDIVQPTVGLVNPVLGGVHRVPRVRVVPERVWIDDLVRKLASHDESVPDDVPLALRAEEEQEFSKVVDETGDLHPFRLSVPSNGLRGLQQVFDLRDGRLGEREKMREIKTRPERRRERVGIGIKTPGNVAKRCVWCRDGGIPRG